MQLNHITYQGPPSDDAALLAQLPENLAALLGSVNGFIQYGGGLHVRGACLKPEWHSLRRAWRGPQAISALFPAAEPDWIPFAQDCVGDQFLLRDAQVLHLAAETGEVQDLNLTLGEFLKRASADPVDFLAMEPLLQFQNTHGALAAGDLLHAYPPFCTKEAAQGVSLRAVPAWEVHRTHAEFARALPPDGTQVQIGTSD